MTITKRLFPVIYRTRPSVGENLARVASLVINNHCLSMMKTLPGFKQLRSLERERKGEALLHRNKDLWLVCIIYNLIHVHVSSLSRGVYSPDFADN